MPLVVPNLICLAPAELVSSLSDAQRYVLFDIPFVSVVWVSITCAVGIFKNELNAPAKVLLFDLAKEPTVNVRSFCIPLNSFPHSIIEGTLKPVGQGLFSPPSKLFQGCTTHTPPVLTVQFACDVQGLVPIALALLTEISAN